MSSPVVSGKRCVLTVKTAVRWVRSFTLMPKLFQFRRYTVQGSLTTSFRREFPTLLTHSQVSKVLQSDPVDMICCWQPQLKCQQGVRRRDDTMHKKGKTHVGGGRFCLAYVHGGSVLQGWGEALDRECSWELPKKKKKRGALYVQESEILWVDSNKTLHHILGFHIDTDLFIYIPVEIFPSPILTFLKLFSTHKLSYLVISAMTQTQLDWLPFIWLSPRKLKHFMCSTAKHGKGQEVN